jgi:hypothetical protein
MLNPKAENTYTGILDEPLPEFKPPGLLSDPDEEQRRWRALVIEKFTALFVHFHIDPANPDAWRQLAITLAFKHVPGFQPPGPKRGRTKEWDMNAQFELCWLIVEYEQRGSNPHAACHDLVKPGRRYEGKDAKTLYRIYQGSPMKMIFEEAAAYDALIASGCAEKQ